LSAIPIDSVWDRKHLGSKETSALKLVAKNLVKSWHCYCCVVLGRVALPVKRRVGEGRKRIEH